MPGNNNVRNRLGWDSRERLRKRNNKAFGFQPNKKEIISLTIPVLIYRKRVSATINTLGQFSKISQELAGYVITKGAEFQETVYQYNDIRKRIKTIFVPLSTTRGAVTKAKFLVDRELKGLDMVLCMPVIRKLGHRVVVGNVTARTNIKMVRQRRGEELAQIERERVATHSEDRRSRNFRDNRRSTTTGHQENTRNEREGRSLHRRSSGRRQAEISEDVIEGLSREEMEEIRSWA